MSSFSTRAASLACGKTLGVASNCTLCNVRVRKDKEFNQTAIIAGFDHILKQCKSGSRCVVNLGFGNSENSPNGQLKASMERLVKSGIVVVTSAGDKARDACQNTFASSSLTISVGNIDIKDQPSGSWGKCVTVYAPGTNVKGASIKNTTATEQGTSTSMSSACKFLDGLMAEHQPIALIQIMDLCSDDFPSLT